MTLPETVLYIPNKFDFVLRRLYCFLHVIYLGANMNQSNLNALQIVTDKSGNQKAYRKTSPGNTKKIVQLESVFNDDGDEAWYIYVDGEPIGFDEMGGDPIPLEYETAVTIKEAIESGKLSSYEAVATN